MTDGRAHAEAQWLVRVRGAVVTHRARRASIVRALDGVDAAVQPGDSTALLGPNGSGKSTLLRVLAGVQGLTSGEIDRRPNLRMGVVFQSPALDPLLTVRENLRLQAALFGLDHAEDRLVRACADHGLDDRLDDRVKTLSGGLARRVEFVRAILAEPDLLLLDEPTVGLDLPSRAALLGAIDALRERRPGIAVVLSTHLMTDAQRCGKVVMMSEGRVASEGAPGELVARLGERVVGVPEGASADGVDLPWTRQADGSLLATPRDAAQLADWTARLTEEGVPFFVRRPTLADAYLHLANAPLHAEPAA